ncbi:hypothetical protein RIR_jg32119.t1 [Rhizophagus irregularis DAOM 181602=DAOM 197198]|uniref:Uncharacterized protein n=1 Tax=Rhizophagus irregularis (strain DAOM 181602 / DAOM 197198 / MUCL 43194) TaxID=747089 RepID=U9SHY5_RHIID|nr:hypothetical protein RIR_jg32119.t1 [Rhizophagus irregularis DAOM 181602=DAOM 197198]
MILTVYFHIIKVKDFDLNVNLKINRALVRTSKGMFVIAVVITIVVTIAVVIVAAAATTGVVFVAVVAVTIAAIIASSL